MTSTTNKVRSTKNYWYEFPDGSSIKTQLEFKGHNLQSHHKTWDTLKDSDQLEVMVRKDKVSGSIDTPIGGICTMELVSKKEFVMSVKQYKEFILLFWENGPDYYDQI